MNRKLNAPQVLLTVVFLTFVLSIYNFLIPEFEYKSILSILVGGVAAYIGAILATTIIKDEECVLKWLRNDITELKNK
ncbi:hypothetical protein GCM10009001_15700 [Virgibacillus siamensis]|uniref:Uncharacterized protein n=1 Tax=Virgibacillus siamensis TaxID=480071 RepID=A0ABP3R2T5_9BACI